MNGENTASNMRESVNSAGRRFHIAAMQPTGRGTFSEVHPREKQTELPRYSASDIPASADLT